MKNQDSKQKEQSLPVIKYDEMNSKLGKIIN